ncbi:conserved hypothetical protein [Thermosulfidibacter takaii ABI70S6]|uniref:Putative Se/S carrier protein-like domain-containing protein n=1 Tax=Thermosulfidibacter takaii (strain DSM 17441 / JCM 13301 / NBRC 103674 / ABI70S6) TaxID=1298851 RepID=A0A0S3QSP9_THET7|nr:DUF3343 domain-containing protein [Thermosulfidibacter takaii]BAT71319.1 conserved hypothetical protein [Thermosulfidibacter takaii ABI70S6]
MWYFLFKGTTEVMKADDVLSNAGVKYEVVPVPKAISSECGMCIRIFSDWRIVLELLLDAGSGVEAVYNESIEKVWP